MKYLGNWKMENKHMGKHIESIRTVDFIKHFIDYKRYPEGAIILLLKKLKGE
jgi:hypothetical protein